MAMQEPGILMANINDGVSADNSINHDYRNSNTQISYMSEQGPKKSKDVWRDLKGRPVNKSITGGWKTTPYVFVICMADSNTIIILSVSLLTYLVMYLNQSTSHAATVLSNNLGTSYLLSIVGGFLADSYLGSFWTIAIGAIAETLGLGLVTFCVTYSKLRPPRCVPSLARPCPSAGPQYTTPLYVGLYLIALGSGFIKPNILSIGADQFDDSIPKEMEQGVHFFLYIYFFLWIGIFIASTLGVYLFTYVSPGWGYGYALIVFALCGLCFPWGGSKFRHRKATGSFLTRMLQVFVAALQKRNVGVIPRDSVELHEGVFAPSDTYRKLPHTPQLRVLDRAAAIEGPEGRDAAASHSRPWEICTVTQVEETKRILQMLPVWVPMAFVGIIGPQIPTFALQMVQTMDRNLGPHFTIPANSVAGIMVTFTTLTFLPIYDQVIVPLVRRFNKNPYGFTPFQRMGACILLALLALVTLALVERKRVSVVREHHFQDMVFGTYILPLKFWWMVPVHVIYGLAEFNYYVSVFEFFYREAPLDTRSVGTAFSFSAISLGNYFSSILVNLVNRLTRHHHGGSWLEGQLNNGGLEKFFWLLTVIMGIVFLVFLGVSQWYTYTYDWYHVQDYSKSAGAPVAPMPMNPIPEESSQIETDASSE